MQLMRLFQFGTLASSVDEDTIGEIKDEKMTTIFGQTEKYQCFNG